MHDPKFENDVQQKLEELSFSPSDAVWNNVQRAVNGRKRRRVPVFWLFLLSGLTLTGAGLIYFSGARKPQAIEHTTSASTAFQDAAGKPAPVVVSSSTQAMSPGAETLTKLPPSVASSATPAISSYSTRSASASRGGRTSSKISSSITQTSLNDNNNISETPEQQTISASTDLSSTAAKASGKQVDLPGLNVFNHRFSAPMASRLPSQSQRSQVAEAAKAPIQLKPKYTWETGFAGGIGASTLNKSLFQQPVVMSDVSPSASAAPINGRLKTYSSEVQPGLSYWAGIVAQRPLKKSLTLSLGLSLHYYSTRVQIGEKFTNNGLYGSPAGYNNSTYLIPSNQQTSSAVSYPFYSVGNKDIYTNHYYFLELPGSLLWQINHSRNLPLFWESGFSLSYLVSSNAISYSAKSSVFYKDGSSTNKTQLNLATAFLVGLPIHGVRLQVGPQIQYGLTNLQNLGAGSQHLLYGGIRLVLLPGKAKN